MQKSRKGRILTSNNLDLNQPTEENKPVNSKIITVDDVLGVLEGSKIEQYQYTDERNVENVISKQLSTQFLIHRQYNIGGFLGLKIDIDINETVGIEIKLSKYLTTANIERLLGQIIYYSKRKYNENLIVLIVGSLSDANTRVIEELESIIADDLKVYFRYLVVTPKTAKK